MNTILRCALLPALLATALGCSAALADDSPAPLRLAESGFTLKLPKAEAVAYVGMVSFDAAGGPSSTMVYPAIGGVAGLLVGIATHGAMMEASKNSEKAKLQEAANKVLDPFRPALAGFSNRELMERAIAMLATPGAKTLIGAADAGDGWVVESVPLFTMTQDLGALVLENEISVYPAGSSSARYRNVVKVVSDVRDEADLQAVWGGEQGKQLKDESVALLAHSLRLVVQELARTPGAEAEVQKTFRYAEGKTQKIERAQLVGQLCDRAVVKTLRGWIMSIPLRKSGDEAPSEQCKNAARYPS
jgi:hypothetical protein